jgi:hypothetical protein
VPPFSPEVIKDMAFLRRKRFSATIITLLLNITLADNTPCPPLGRNFPLPKSPSTASTIASVIAVLQKQLELSIKTGNSSNGLTPPNTTSFSIALFSTENNSSDPYLWQYHPTAPSLSISAGVKSVDADSVYCIGTLTQLFTVYAFLTKAGDVHWEEPVTKWVPDLAQAAKTLDAKSQPLRYVDWGDVTLVASHLSGIARDCESQLVFGRRNRH